MIIDLSDADRRTLLAAIAEGVRRHLQQAAELRALAKRLRRST